MTAGLMVLAGLSCQGGPSNTANTPSANANASSNKAATLPTPPPSFPSNTAKENGWKENTEFGGVNTDFTQPGYVGDFRDTAGNLTAVTEQDFVPTCGKTFVLQEGETQRVADCATAPPNYQALCRKNRDDLLARCKALCAKTAGQPNPCINFQLQPHIYEEWGCLGGVIPPSTIVVPPRQFCDTYEGCICTSEIQ